MIYRRLKNPKECPGCGEHNILLAGIRLCDECKKYIKLGRELESKILRDDDLIEIVIGDGFVYEHDVNRHQQWTDELEHNESNNIIRSIADMISLRNVDGKSLWSSTHHGIPGKEKVTIAPGDHGGWYFSALASRHQVELVTTILASIYRLIRYHEKHAYREGRALISDLASGRVSIDSYNDQLARNE